MSQFVVRKVTEQDRKRLSELIVLAFESELLQISKDMTKVASALESSFLLERFFVYEQDGEILGVISCSDCYGRAYRIDKEALKKHFGLVKGTMVAIFLKKEYMTPLNYPLTTGYIENVAVDNKVRRMGVATKLLDAVIAETNYTEYVLDVLKDNIVAQNCYKKFGFDVFDNVQNKKSRKKLYMKYIKQ